MTYSEDDIIRGLSRAGVGSITAGTYLASIRQNAMKKEEAPVWADSDTVTVKELLEAEGRLKPQGFPSTVFSLNRILQEVSASREPEYPAGTVWKDASEIVWMRAEGEMWLRMGWSGSYSHTYPKRPLKKMDVI